MSEASAKNLRKNVVFSGVGYALPLLAALVTIPVMVGKLGTDLYGLYVICISLVGFMTLVDLGAGQTIVKYVAAYEAEGERHKVQPVLNLTLLVYLVIGLISALGLYFSAPVIAGFLYEDASARIVAENALKITVLPLFFGYVNQYFLNVCKAYHRFDLPAIIHNGANMGGIILATIMLLAGYSLIEMLWGYVLVYLLALISGVVAGLRVLKGRIPFPWFDKHVFFEMLSFSSYTFLGNFLSSLASRADKLFIGVIVGTEAVTFYQVSFTVAQMANGIIHTLVHIVFPRFSELWALNNRKGLLSLYKTVSTIMLLISLMIAILLIAVGSDFLVLWISAEFAQQAGLTLQIIALYFFLHSNTVTGYWVLQGAGKAGLTALIALTGTCAYFLGMYYLGGLYSYNGIAMALFLLLLAMPLQYIWIASHIGHSCVNYISRLLVFLLLGVLIVYSLETLNAALHHSLWKILLNGILVGITGTLAIWLVVRQSPVLMKAEADR